MTIILQIGKTLSREANRIQISIKRKITKKVQNLRNRPNVYFSIDDGNFPYKGVKGKGIAAIIEDPHLKPFIILFFRSCFIL
jgi:hypothetical protein